jgi:hypothetical protein
MEWQLGLASWVQSLHPPTQWNLRGCGRGCNTVGVGEGGGGGLTVAESEVEKITSNPVQAILKKEKLLQYNNTGTL